MGSQKLFLFIFTLALLFNVTNAESEDYASSRERHLIIGAFRSPLANIPNSTNPSAGAILEVKCLQILANYLNFTFQIITPNDFLYGVLLQNDSWTGAMGMVQRKEVDMCMSFSPPGARKSQTIDSSYPVFFDDTSIVIPYPKESTFERIAAVWAPFSSHVWVVLGIFALVTPFILWVISYYGKKINFIEVHRNITLAHCYLLTVEMTISRRALHRNQSLAYRFITACILISSLILTNLYSAIYTSLITVPHYNVNIKSIEDVAANPYIKVYGYKGSPTVNYIESSTDKTIKIVGDQFRRHPNRKLLIQDYFDDMSALIHDDRVFVLPTSGAVAMVQQSYEKNNRCRLAIAEKKFYSRTQCISYPKNSPWLKPIDGELLLLHQAGLLNHAMREEADKKRNPCTIGTGRNIGHTFEAFTLISFVGAFFVWAIGVTFSLLAFIVESRRYIRF